MADLYADLKAALNRADQMAPSNPSTARDLVAKVQAATLIDIAFNINQLATIQQRSMDFLDDPADEADDLAAAARLAREPGALAVNDLVVLNDPDDPDDDDADVLLVIATGESEGDQWVNVAWLNGHIDRKVWASKFKFVRALGNDADAVEPYLTAVAKASKKKGKGDA
jgi:hypothetical protein